MNQKSNMHVAGESDGRTVPTKCPNKNGKPLAEGMEGRRPTKENIEQTTASQTQSWVNASSGLLGVREAAKREGKTRFTALLHHVTVPLLLDSFYALKRDAAPGVDGVTWKEYETDLDKRLQDLHSRVHRGTYRAQPSKRTYIPKADGRKRPLGIAALEDKIVQHAVVTVLNQIYEEDFLGFSYGFRPGRSQHQALDALWVGLIRKKVNWVLDADIRDFFGSISHEWLGKFIEHRIADRRILRLIRKWLRAGVSEEGAWAKTEVGTPQGAVITPLTQKVTLAVWPTWRQTAVLWGARWDWDAVANGDGVVPHQNVFDHEPYDSLALCDIKRLSSTAQAGEERRESLRQSQEGCPIVGLVSDRLQLSTKRLFPLAQRRHALAQLLDRQECFLVGIEKSFHAFANMRQFPLQTLLTFLGRIARARGCQPAVKFLLDQGRVFQESDHLGPDDLIEEILSDQAAVVANRTAQFSPAIGANTFVVVDLARGRARRCAREGVAALLTEVRLRL